MSPFENRCSFNEKLQQWPRRGVRPVLAFVLAAFLVLVGSLGQRVLSAEISAGAFEAANKLYYAGKFGDAASAYENLIPSAPASATLYFNLGNAWFKSGKLGRAIAAYRQAERLTPRDPDVRANLQFARNQAQGPSLTLSRWERWLDKLTLNEWTMLASVSFWVWLLSLSLFQWRPSWRRSARPLLFGLTAGCLVLCGCLAAVWYQERSTQIAVVVTPEAMTRTGPLDESKNAFAVHDGAELRVLDHKDEWLQVTTDPRRIGWLRRDQVLLATR
jgi:tetratricopeptide (TPR) repeat protein